jgi:hypothetical protein
MSHTLADHLQIWGFEQDFIIYSDGSLGFVLDCIPIDVSTWDDERINNYSESVSQFLNSLPDKVDIQFVQDIIPGNESIINRHKELAVNARNETAKSLCDERVLRMHSADKAGDVPTHRLKIVFRKPLSQNLIQKPTLFSKEKLFSQISETRLSREIEILNRMKENLVQGLSHLEISSRLMSTDEVAELLYQQWNPSRRIPFKSYNPEEIRQSLLYSDVGINIGGFVIGTTHLRVLSLKSLPDQTYASMSAKLRELPFKSRLFVTVHVPEQMKEIESLQTQRRIAFSMAVGKRTGVSDLESTAKFQDLETLLEQMIAQGQKVFHVSITIILQSESEADLENQVDITLNKFRELSGSEAMTETLAAFNIFSKVALPNARSKERSKRIKTSNLCDLIPLFGPWPGHPSPSILLKSRMGSLLSFNPFDSSLVSANQLISGGSRLR